MRRPYLLELGRCEGLGAFLVDGEWIRNHWDVDFTNGAHHLTRAYVPLLELWVDREAPGAGELPFLVQHQANERAYMVAGASYLQALAAANRRERRARRATWPSLPATPKEARARVRRERLGLVDGVELWLVRGRAVRDLFDPNFTEGGHGLRYRFIPRREVWVDDALVQSERHFIVEHEICELALMRGGMGYDDAHDLALGHELALRQEALSGGRQRVA